jgi:hypothetical protein
MAEDYNKLKQREQNLSIQRNEKKRIIRNIKDIVEDPKTSDAQRAKYRTQLKNAQTELKKLESDIETTAQSAKSLAGESSVADIEKKYLELKRALDLQLNPDSNSAKKIQSDMDDLVGRYQNAISLKAGAQISPAVAKARLTGTAIPTLSTPAGIDPTSYQAKKAAEAQAAQGPKVGQTPKANTPAATGGEQIQAGPGYKGPKTPPKKTPSKTDTALKDEALSVAATDLSLPEVLFNRVPSLKNLLERYVAEKWTADKLRKEIRNDNWYKQNSAEIKTRYIQKYNYDDLVASGQAQGTTDYEMKIAQIEKSLAAKAAQLGSGAASDPAALRKAAENLYITNRSEDQSYITDFLAASIRPTSSMIGGRLTEGYSGAALLDYQNLQSIAKNNGFRLSDIIPGAQTEQQVLAGIANGTIDANRIAQDARKLAAQGQPTYVRDLLGQGYDLSQVYAPYKQTMASILELNPDQIDLNDPTLRMGITDKGDMNIYEFQKELRKDNRWQYTGNARESVSTAALQVLRDFGFQG